MLKWLRTAILNRNTKSDNLIEKSHVLYIDETGTDGKTKKVAYIGCLFDSEYSDNLNSMIISFNQSLLDNPRFSGVAGKIISSKECRHYTEDSYTVRELFFAKVIDKLPMRIYIISADYNKNNLEATKVALMNRLINVVQSARRIVELDIVAEKSDKSFERQFPRVRFENKEFLPLSVADYIAGGVRACYEIIARASSSNIPGQKENSFDVQFYLRIENMIAYEEDLSVHSISSRRKRNIGDELRTVIQ